MKHLDEKPLDHFGDAEALLKPALATKYLNERHGIDRSPTTLRNLRVKGGGPAFHKFGNEVFYTKVGLDGWVKKKLSKPLLSTSELP
jgi:hypothetical protein